MPRPTYRVDEKLKEWATPRQAEIIDAINTHKSKQKAARELGVNYSTVHQAVERLEAKAAIFGYSPKHDLSKPVAPGQILRGASHLYRRGEVEPVLTWVKSRADDEAREQILRAAYEAMATELPRLDATAGPPDASPNLCNVFTLTDSHVGALCWGKETGADWDLKIAERVLVGCFAQMVHSCPSAKIAVIAQLGDFLHQDSMSPVTPTSGHLLDADGRFTKVVQVAVRVLRQVVDIALQRHEKVLVLMAEGNHDISSSIWLRTMFAALYENEPRIEVIDSPLPYYVYQHGKTLLAWHHGHLKKNAELPLLFAAQFPQEWGSTLKRYVHTGHRHHVEEKEHSGMKVIQHPTLTARDAYAARGGWVAEREATAITYHDKFGQVARVTVTPEMLEPA